MNGNTLEEQVEKILKDDGWKVSSEVFYTDPNTQKPREKDIIARKHQDNHNYDAILFVECKSIPEATRIHQKGKMEDIESTLITNNIPFADISEMERNKQTHFYAKYREFFKSKDSGDFLYKAVNQNLQFFRAFRKNNQQVGVYYLLVVFDGTVFYLDDSKNQQNCDGALIRINALDNTFSLPNGECFIEIVSILNLKNLLQEIEKDIALINKSAHFYHQMEQNRINENRRNRMNNTDYGL
ncbi:MAG: hypothetical protein WC621_00180 [Patescibacteria group bacterium]